LGAKRSFDNLPAEVLRPGVIPGYTFSADFATLIFFWKIPPVHLNRQAFMKKVFVVLATLLTFLWLSGCGSTGKNFPTTKVSEIQNKVTTRTQILAWFGTPPKEGVRDGDVLWTYQFDTFNPIGKDLSKELVILFDPAGVVKAYRFSSNMDR